MATNPYLKQRIEERNVKTQVLRDMQDIAARENRDLNDNERKTFEEMQGRLGFLDDEIKRITEAEAASAKYMEIYGAHKAAEERSARATERTPAAERVIEVRSWGDTFVNSDGLRGWNGGRGAPVEMPFGLLEQRAATDPITTTDLAAGVQPATFTPREPTWRNTLLDAVGREPVNANAVEWIRFQPDVPPEVEPTAEGDLKPALDITLVEKSVTLETYAAYKPITRQALEDYPRIRSVVEGYLRQSLRESLEGAVATAIDSDTDIPSVGTAGTTPLLISIRAAMAQVEINGFVANTVIVNPGDWAAMDVGTAVLAATIPGVQRGFWGLAVVASTRLPSGTAYVGDLTAAVTLFDRNRTNVFLTDSHNQNFLRNILVVLAETRAYAAVTQPAAMCKAVGDPAACVECADGSVSVPSLPGLLAPPPDTGGTGSTGSTSTATTGSTSGTTTP